MWRIQQEIHLEDFLRDAHLKLLLTLSYWKYDLCLLHPTFGFCKDADAMISDWTKRGCRVKEKVGKKYSRNQ